MALSRDTNYVKLHTVIVESTVFGIHHGILIFVNIRIDFNILMKIQSMTV